MKAPNIFIFLGIFSIGVPYSSANSKVTLYKNVYTLKSDVVDYPNNADTHDIIWLFNHSITLTIDEFHLNGHDGDFLFISEHPIVDVESIINGTDDGSYVSELAKSIVTDQGILLSWQVKKVVEALNPTGTFVLFHTEGKTVVNSQFTGFVIEVENYDESIITTTTIPPDPVIPEQPDQKIYISKFLDCMEPLRFFSQLNYFKDRIAQLTTEYCNETDIPLEKGPITRREVNIPGPEAERGAGVHYCDRTWSNYNTCVEVTFAINRLTPDGIYILPAEILEDMWEKKSEDLRRSGYCPYEPPPGTEDLTALGWIIFLLGVILVLTALLLIAWLKNARSLLDYKLSFTKDFRGSKDESEVTDEKPPPKHYDTDNPLFNYISSSPKRPYESPQEEVLTHSPNRNFLRPSGGLHLDSDSDDDSSLESRRPSFTKNPTFQETPVDVYAYDNDGFKGDNDAAVTVEDEETRSNHSKPGPSSSVKGSFSEASMGWSMLPGGMSRLQAENIGDPDFNI